MKPPKSLNARIVALLGMVLTAVTVAYSQVAPVPAGPQRPTAFPGAASGPMFFRTPCPPNLRVPTMQEQLQNNPNITLSEIQQNEVRAVACKVNPAVVEVIASGFGAAPGQEYETVAMATPGPSIGSGVVVTADGYIMTNRHVIKGAPKITVVLHADGKPEEQVPATLAGQDGLTDLALLKIDKTGMPFLDLPRFLIQVRQGDAVYAFGSPRGVGISMSKGIISSATIRQVDDGSSERDHVDYIQTDAVINPGNSGGALVDIHGNLIGINTFILSSSGGNEGLNFAIPADVVSRIYDQIKTNGYVVRGDIGITTRNLSPELIRALKIPVQTGVFIENVAPASPADVAGLKVEDIVVAYDGRPFNIRINPDSATELDRAIFQKHKGDNIRLDVLRDGNPTPKSINITARQLSQEQDGLGLQLTSDQVISQLGIYGLSISFNFAAQHNLLSPRGIMVAAKVQTMSPLTELQVEDVIHKVNTTPVATLDELRHELDSIPSGTTVFLQVERDHKMTYMPVFLN